MVKNARGCCKLFVSCTHYSKDRLAFPVYSRLCHVYHPSPLSYSSPQTLPPVIPSAGSRGLLGQPGLLWERSRPQHQPLMSQGTPHAGMGGGARGSSRVGVLRICYQVLFLLQAVGEVICLTQTAHTTLPRAEDTRNERSSVFTAIGVRGYLKRAVASLPPDCPPL